MQFETTEIWQRSFELCCQVYEAFKRQSDFGFRNQICRSALSVPSNIAERLERDFEKEKVRFLRIAKGSLAELKTQIRIAQRIGYLDEMTAQPWIGECEHLSRMMAAFINRIASQNH